MSVSLILLLNWLALALSALSLLIGGLSVSESLLHLLRMRQLRRDDAGLDHVRQVPRARREP